MADGKYLRGEVYWVCLDDSIGGEEKTGRPGVIVSADKPNETNESVTIAFTTKQGFAAPSRPSIADHMGGRMRVLCDQLRTVDKSRLSRYMFTIDESELTRVTGALAVAMCIPYGLKNKDTDMSEVESLKLQVAMYQKLYEKTMDQLVDMKLAADIAKKIETKESVSEESPEPPKDPEPIEEPEKYEVNTCSTDDLMKCGCTLAMARLIVSYRPYKALGDLRRVPGVKAMAFQLLKNKLYCVPMPPEEKPKVLAPVEPKPVQSVPKKANVNTATAQELHEIAGITLSDAYGITAYRKKIGIYKSLEDLLQAPRYTEGKLKKHRAKLEV